MKTEILHALRIANKHKPYVFLSSLVDILFFVVYGFATAPIFQKLTEHVLIIGGLASEAVLEATRQEKSMFTIFSMPEIAPFFNNIFWLLLILGVTVFMVYNLFQAVNWKIALDLTGKKIKYLDYLKRFMLLNVVWFLLFCVYYVLTFVVDIRKAAIKVITAAPAPNILNFVLTICLVLILYFAFISYITMSVRKSFRLGKKFKKFITPLLIIIAYFVAVNIISMLLAKISMALMFVFGLFLIIPAFTIGRIYISLVVQRIK